MGNTTKTMKLILEKWRKFLNEGGNVFVGQTASIPKEFIEPTLEKYRKELNRLFPLKKQVFSSFRPVGSVGKKPVSGDIDLAGDATSFFPTGEVTPEELKSWNINPIDWKSTFNNFKKRARSRTDAELGWRAFLTELAKYINENSELIITDPKQVGPGIMFSLFPQFSDENKQQDIGVQIDWMIGRADWLEFAYYSDPPSKKDSYIKGLHRTQLMLAMFLIKNVSYHHSSGLKDRGTKRFITNSPKEVLKMLGSLYGSKINRSTTNNFHALHEWLKKNATTEEYEEVISAYLKILDSTKSAKIRDQLTGEEIHCGYIPKELEDFWIKNQEEIGLKGKYICRDVNEKIWNHIKGN